MLESTRSCSRRSIWKNADSRTSWVSSIRSSAITSSWMRNAVRQPCIFITSPVRRLKDRRRPTRNWYTPKLNTAYHELAEHYDTVILPAKVRHPKDKPSAEGNVGHASTLLIAALRHEQFFSLADLNAALAEKLEAYNHRPFQKRDGCRLDIFLQEERPYLAQLPIMPYEVADWKLVPPNEQERSEIAELIHNRRRHAYTIFCSQYDDREWFDQLGGENRPLAESILDRIVHDAYRVKLEAIDPEQDISMREIYGLKDEY